MQKYNNKNITIIIFGILNIVDYITTTLAISHGAVEGNPIAYYFVGNNGLHYYKLVGVVLVCIFLIHVAKRNLKNQLSVIRVLWATNLRLGILCTYNVVAYFIQKHDFALRKIGPLAHSQIGEGCPRLSKEALWQLRGFLSALNL